MNFSNLTDKTQIETFLNADRGYNAYALADLASPFFEQCRWLAMEDAGEIATLVLLFYGISPPALLAMGQADYLPDILAQADLPSLIMFLGLAAHVPHFLNYYHPRYLDPMLRMFLTPDNFQAIPSQNVHRLDESHLNTLQTMYKDAHGNAFEASQLQLGVFYGIFTADELVAAAGTHIVSPEYNIAAVGNIYTKPHYRGQGYAQQVSSAVCKTLVAQNIDIILNVEQKNTPAIHIYKKLGFSEYCMFWEGVGERKK